MPRHHNLFNDAQQEFINNPQNTHTSAITASAAKLMVCLRERYPQIYTLSSNKINSLFLAEPQASLIEYLRALLSNGNCPIPYHPQINAVLQVIQLFLESQDFNSEEKTLLFKQMISLSQICPGIEWREEHIILSTCTYFDEKKGIDVEIVAPVSEALNLVACSIMDLQYHVSPDQTSSMIANLGKILIDLETQHERQSFDICSTGRRHELISFLSGKILDALPSQNGQPIKLVFLETTLYAETIINYLQTRLNELDELNNIQWVRAWILDQYFPDASHLPPITRFLRTLHPSDHGDPDSKWTNTLIDLLKERCRFHGINPDQAQARNKMAEVLSSLGDLETPMTHWKLQPYLMEIFSTKPFPIQYSLLDKRSLEVFNACNLGLIHFKNKLRMHASWNNLEASIEIFYEYLTLVKFLKNEIDNLIFLQNYPALTNIKEQLANALISFFQNLNFIEIERIVKDPEIERLATLFKTLKNDLAQWQTGLISNYFAVLGSAGYIPESHSYANLKQLFQQGKIPHLNEHQLLLWQKNCTNLQGEVYLSPFQINCVLMQIIVSPASEWSDVQKNIFTSVLLWLLNLNPNDDHLLQNFKQSYPQDLLANLLWLLLAPTPNAAVSHQNEQLFKKSLFNLYLQQNRNLQEDSPLLTLSPEIISMLIQNSETLYSWLALDSIMESFSNGEEHVLMIWLGIQKRLPSLIKSVRDIFNLLTLEIPKLMIDDIWSAAKGKYRSLINNSVDLRLLTLLPAEVLSVERFSEITTELGNNLLYIIDPDLFFRLYSDKRKLIPATLLLEPILKDKGLSGLNILLNKADTGPQYGCEYFFDTIIDHLKQLFRERWLSDLLQDSLVQNKTAVQYFFNLFIRRIGIAPVFLMLEALEKSLRLSLIKFFMESMEPFTKFNEFTRLFALNLYQFPREERDFVIQNYKSLDKLFSTSDSVLTFLAMDIKLSETSIQHIFASLSSSLPSFFANRLSLLRLLAIPEGRLSFDILCEQIPIIFMNKTPLSLDITRLELERACRESQRDINQLLEFFSALEITINEYCATNFNDDFNFFHKSEESSPKKIKIETEYTSLPNNL